MNKINTSLTINNNFSDKISCDNYHNIFYRGELTPKNTNILTRIIREQNNKYKHLPKYQLIKKPINLHINSIGGELELGLICYDIIKTSKIPIYTYANGIVASAASILFLAGTKRYMFEHSKLLIHQLSSDFSGKHTEFKDHLYNTNILMNECKKIYLEETKIKPKMLNNLLQRDIYLTSNECLKYGFTNYIYTK